MFQNANLSVRVTDDFMQAVEKNEDWTTHWVTDPKQPGPTYPARELMDRMAECAWHCGDPGVQYDTTINRWHTCPNSGRINASNPCSEYMFLDDTACNLASINLMKFRKADGTFDAERFKAACRIYFIAQEILVDHASYPTPDIAGTATCSGRSVSATDPWKVFPRSRSIPSSASIHDRCPRRSAKTVIRGASSPVIEFTGTSVVLAS